MIAVSMNVGGGVRLIKLAKLYMCMQTHYKHDEDGHTALGVRSHGSVPLSHSLRELDYTHTHTHNSVILSLDLIVSTPPVSQ